jgi:nitroreductase
MSDLSHQTAILSKLIRSRITEKVMCDPGAGPEQLSDEIENLNRHRVLESIETAGWAPLHYSRGVDGIAEPWRAHILWRQRARDAAQYMQETLKVKTKEPRLASACSALVLATWLPETSAPDDVIPSSDVVQKIVSRNEEHLAASASMVQNFLLMLTAHGMGNYWSSGGRFRGSEMFDYLSIPKTERLLAAVFIEYPDEIGLNPETKERKPGAQRGNRSQKWFREVS